MGAEAPLPRAHLFSLLTRPLLLLRLLVLTTGEAADGEMCCVVQEKLSLQAPQQGITFSLSPRASCWPLCSESAVGFGPLPTFAGGLTKPLERGVLAGGNRGLSRWFCLG